MTAPTPDTEERPDALVEAWRRWTEDFRPGEHVTPIRDAFAAGWDAAAATPPQADRGLREALLACREPFRELSKAIDLLDDDPAIEEAFEALSEALGRADIAALRDTPPAGLDVELLIGALAAVDHRIAVEFPEEAVEMESDQAALGRRSYGEAVAAEYALLREQAAQIASEGATE